MLRHSPLGAGTLRVPLRPPSPRPSPSDGSRIWRGAGRESGASHIMSRGGVLHSRTPLGAAPSCVARRLNWRWVGCTPGGRAQRCSPRLGVRRPARPRGPSGVLDARGLRSSARVGCGCRAQTRPIGQTSLAARMGFCRSGRLRPSVRSRASEARRVMPGHAHGLVDDSVSAESEFCDGMGCAAHFCGCLNHGVHDPQTHLAIAT